MMATLPPTAHTSQQPVNIEDEDGILDEYDQYSLAQSYVGKVCMAAPWSASPLLTPNPILPNLLANLFPTPKYPLSSLIY